MDNMSPLISSYEEVGFGYAGNSGGGYGVDGEGFGDTEDHNWLTKLLGEVDKIKGVDDSEDVVFVSEVFSNPRNKVRLLSPERCAEVVAVEGEDDDDDCVILDSDPEKPVLVGNVWVCDDGDNGSDDLVIISEKGKVACRDFPHPRHLCAKFLFASTPHEVHCVQCHCYVCDSLAPCSNWGTGISSVDHCHASDKEEHWIAERQTKKGVEPSFFTEFSFQYVAPPQPSREPSSLLVNQSSPALAPPHCSSLLVNQGLKPALASPHPSSLLVNHSLSPLLAQPHPSSLLANRSSNPVSNDLNQGSVYPQLNTCNNNVTSRERSCNSENRRSQLVSPQTVFKRTRYTESSPNNRLGCVKSYHMSQLSTDRSLNSCQTLQTPILNQLNGHALLKSSAPPSMDVRYANYIPSQPQVISGSISNSLIRPEAQPQMTSQPYLSSNIVNPNSVFQSNCSLPSQTRPIMGNNNNTIFQNQALQPHAYSQQIGHDTNLTNICFDLEVPLNHHNLQAPADISLLQSALPAGNSQYQCVTGDDHNQNIAPVNNFLQKSVTPADNPFCLDVNDNFLFESWMFQNHSLPGALTVPVSPHWNVFSPEPAP